MTDLAITAADVGYTTTAPGKREVVYGDTVTEGMPLYLNADGQYHPAANTSATLANVAGIAVTPGADGERGTIVTAGDFECGAATVEGEIYVLSAAGLISPVGDHTTGDYLTIIGHGRAGTNILRVGIVVTGVAKA